MGTKLYENSFQPIRPDRYYVWTWVPKEYEGRTRKHFYPKHLTGVPYYSSEHLKITLKLYYGRKVLDVIHIISGKQLLKEGVYGLDLNLTRASSKFWYRGKLRRAYRFYYPPEYRFNKYEKHLFMKRLTDTFTKYGKEAFNQEYKFSLIGQREGFSPKLNSRKRAKIRDLIIPHLQTLEGKGEEEVRKILMGLYPHLKMFGPLVQD